MRLFSGNSKNNPQVLSMVLAVYQQAWSVIPAAAA
jgi:hypothetical protein